MRISHIPSYGRPTGRAGWPVCFCVVAIVVGLDPVLGAGPSSPAASKSAPAKTSPAPSQKSSPAEQPEPLLLKEDVATAGILDVDGKSMAQFRVEVPADAVLMTVRVLDCPLMLDIMARADKPMASPDEAEQHSTADVLDPALRVARQSIPPLVEGTWYVGVAYLESALAVVHKRPVKRIPFSIKVSFARARITAVLQAGQKIRGQVRVDEGSVCSFVIDVPAAASVLRIDVDEVSSDLDILARQGLPLVSNDAADAAAISPLGRESLLVGGTSSTPLRPGQWYINVIHPACYGTVNFTLYASFSSDPPAELLAIPPLERPTDPRKRAIQATVNVATEMGGASGTLLTDQGLILTNYHVVAEVAENSSEKDPVVVAVTLDPRNPPRELFRGRVTAFDKQLDLALVQITTGLYHQPLPPGYRFPTIPLGDSAAATIGDVVLIAGYPSIGGTSGRASVTLTQGVLGGFERTSIGTLMKTDANISPGNSGGAALDSQWRLIGVPTFENINPEAVSRMSYVHPLSLLPPAWRTKVGLKIRD